MPPVNSTLSEQGDTRPKYRLLAAGGVNVNRRTSSTPHSVALPATKIRYLGSEGVLRLRFVILQGTGTKRTGRTLSDSNAAESQICGAKPCVPLSTEGILCSANRKRPHAISRRRTVLKACDLVSLRMFQSCRSIPPIHSTPQSESPA